VREESVHMTPPHREGPPWLPDRALGNPFKTRINLDSIQ
jgi:hypothetical protein